MAAIKHLPDADSARCVLSAKGSGKWFALTKLFHKDPDF